MPDSTASTPHRNPQYDSFSSRVVRKINGEEVVFYSLKEAEKNGLEGISRLPFSLKILLETLLRHEDGKIVTRTDIEAMAKWVHDRHSDREIAFHPTRILMQDFTGVPAVVDLAAMRDATAKIGGDPQSINPKIPVDLIIDHSVMVDEFGTPTSFEHNVEREYARNRERYAFLRWGQSAFDQFSVVPPGTGICHQVNLEYLAKVVWEKEEAGTKMLFSDSLVGTDSHTTMVNSLSVLGWGVGGIEAEAAMLGQPISMLIPDVVGVCLAGALPEGVTATDLVLTIAERLRQHGVVGKFVEFYGSGLSTLSLEETATIANMAPEFGANIAFFPVDEKTLTYLRMTGRAEEHVKRVEMYTKEQGLFREEGAPDPVFTQTLTIKLNEIEPCLAGPRRPQDRVPLYEAASEFRTCWRQEQERRGENPSEKALEKRFPVPDKDYDLGHGDVVIAAITSCTNTSNPSILMMAGLLARKARARGLVPKPWVKTSLAPGSQVVTDYLTKAGLQEDLDALGFNLVGYGCTTCIGNSGLLLPEIAQSVEEKNLLVCSVLSGNRNFEGRINPYAHANYLASPPLVVAYALTGTLLCDITKDPLGYDPEGKAVFLKDIWPSAQEATDYVHKYLSGDMFTKRYKDVFKGDKHWQGMSVTSRKTYDWPEESTYIQHPPFFEGFSKTDPGLSSFKDAAVLALFGDSVTTDHISPAGAIPKDSPAGLYLQEKGVFPLEFNSYGARRGNHHVMMRGTFANIRIKNQMLDGQEGGYTRYIPTGEMLSIYDAAMRYMEKKTPLVVLAGKEYGTGSSRDWAAKGTRLLGVRAVIAESFERIHRSNLIGMGVIPLLFQEGMTWKTLEMTGDETLTIEGLSDAIQPKQVITAVLTSKDQRQREIPLRLAVDTSNEMTYLRAGGILAYVLRRGVRG